MTTSAAERKKTESYTKLPSAKNGQFCVTRVTPTTVTVDKDCIRKSVSEDKDTRAPTSNNMIKEDKSTKTDDHDAERIGTHAGTH